MDDGKDGPMWPFYVQQLFFVRAIIEDVSQGSSFVRHRSCVPQKWIDDRLGVLGHMAGNWSIQSMKPIPDACLIFVGLTLRESHSTLQVTTCV
jgi:hypothetical protein